MLLWRMLHAHGLGGGYREGTMEGCSLRRRILESEASRLLDDPRSTSWGRNT